MLGLWRDIGITGIGVDVDISCELREPDLTMEDSALLDCPPFGAVATGCSAVAKTWLVCEPEITLGGATDVAGEETWLGIAIDWVEEWSVEIGGAECGADSANEETRAGVFVDITGVAAVTWLMSEPEATLGEITGVGRAETGLALVIGSVEERSIEKGRLDGAADLANGEVGAGIFVEAIGVAVVTWLVKETEATLGGAT